MKRIATVRFKWVSSPSPKAQTVDLTLTIDGDQTFVSLPANTQTYDVEVAAFGTVNFEATVTDSNGLVSSHVSLTATLGDLVGPLPISGLGYNIVSIREVPEDGDTTTTPPPSDDTTTTAPPTTPSPEDDE
jgi:hypothetical protein